MNRAQLRPWLIAAPALLALAGQGQGRAEAGAPQVRKQAPGYYRMILGDFEVTAVSDGTIPQDFSAIMTNTTAEEVRSLFAGDREPLPTAASVNTFLINTGAELVQVDAGAGDLFGPKVAGRLVANLEAAGYRPGQVDAVLLTHLHGDHAPGLTVRGKAIFPNAAVFVDRREKDYWLSEAEGARAPADRKPYFAQARAALEPYLRAGRVRTFEAEGELFPGIKARPHAVHTPGHTDYQAESRGQKLVLIGDTVHAAQVQFPRPDVTIGYDVDPPAAAARRRRIFAEAADQGSWIGAAHISFPGLGHIRRGGRGYAWIPATYRDLD